VAVKVNRGSWRSRVKGEKEISDDGITLPAENSVAAFQTQQSLSL
jgi:hypothetical protein